MKTSDYCAVCGDSMAVPYVRPSSGVWTHSDPQECIRALRAVRATLNSEIGAWRKRAEQAEGDLAAAEARGYARALEDAANGVDAHAQDEGSVYVHAATIVRAIRARAALDKVSGGGR